jgi:Phage portal protein
MNRWRDTHRGVARAHRIAMLEAGMTWVPNQHSLKDMDFATLRGVMRDIIREAVGMHKVMTGVVEDVNRANAQTGEEIFSSWKVDPRLKRWRNVLNSQFLPLFGKTGDGVEWDYTYPTVANREQDNAELTTKTAAVAVLVGAGFDPHDALQVVGLPDMDVVEQATQQPALPPGWVAPAPAPGEGSGAGEPGSADDVEAALRRALLQAVRGQRRELAALNMAGGRR